MMKRFLFLSLSLSLVLALAPTSHAQTFPSTSLIDQFNRADDAAPLDSPWGSVIISGNSGLAISSNLLVGGTGIAEQVYGTTYGPDSELFLTIVTIPADGLTFRPCFLRVANAGTATPNGYGLAITMASGAETWQIFRMDSGAFTTIGSPGSQTLANTDKVGCRMTGTTFSAYIFTAGSWNQTPVASTTDATYGAAGTIGIRFFDPTMQGDDFGGGTMGGGAPQRSLTGVGS